MGLSDVYRKHYRRMLYLPLFILLLYVYLVFFWPGVKLGLDFTGGVAVSFRTDHPYDPTALEKAIKSKTGVPDVKVTPTQVGGVYGGIVEIRYPEEIVRAFSLLEQAKKAANPDPYLQELSRMLNVPPREENIVAALESKKEAFKSLVVSIVKEIGAKDVVVRDVAPTLGGTFWNTAIWIAFWAFVLLTISVFVFFRQVVPSFIMIGSAIFDLMGMLALMAVFNIPLTLETVAVLLMQVGYSIDTDIVLSTHLLKRKEGDEFQRAARAAKTGIHMTGTTFLAMLFVYAVGFLTTNLTVMRIANVMFFGLISDLFVTWLMNASVLIMWVRRHASAA